MDYQEELEESLKKLRNRKMQEELNEGQEEEGKELEVMGWQGGVEGEVEQEFRRRCQDRLKRSDDLNWIAYSERFKNLRLIKNMQTIRKPSKVWME